MLDKIKEDLKKAITEFTIEDFNIYTMNELYMQVANKTNEVIEIVKLLQDYLDEQIFKDVENIDLKQKALENIFNQLIINAGNSNAEIVDARVEADGTTHNKLRDRLNKVDSQIKDIENKTNDYLKKICIMMPESSGVDENTNNLQSILNLAKDKNVNLTVQFPAGYYELKPCTIFDNTIIKLTNNTTLKSVPAPYYNKNFNVNEDIEILFFNAIPHNDNELNITGYNGRSNITIEGGIFDVASAFCLIHGQNITIKNVVFKNGNYDHYMQIGSCKNVRIENCEFIGVTERASNRQYVEMIQIDWCNFTSMPYWRKDGAIYDDCINDGVEIINCKFRKGSGDYAYFPCAIGSHAGTSGINNKNITIKDCEFVNFDYAGLTLKYMDKVVVENNKFFSTSNDSGYGITIDNCFNVDIGKGNYFNGNARSISLYNNCDKIKMHDFTVEECTRQSDVILMGESKNIIVDGVVFRKCNITGEILKSRNNHYVSINNCKVFECSTSQNFFANVYLNSSGTSSHVDVSNNIVSFAEVYFNPNVANVKRTKDQILWSGGINSGSLTLNDSIEKYQDLKITYDVFGSATTPLNFVDNKCVLKAFNMPDSGDTLSVSFFEVHLLLNDKTITIDKIRELNINNGVMAYVENPNSFYLKEIKGSKIRL